MSVENDLGGQAFISCDGKRCNETTGTYDSGDFQQMVHDAKRAGWKIENRRGQYFHTCPACAEDDEFDDVS